MITIFISILVLALLLLTLATLVRRSVSEPGGLPLDAGWIDELSVERYRPMMRLLDDRDLEFLRSQPGFSPGMATRLRIQRRQIFQGYLRCLEGDFQRVCMALKVLMLQSRHDRPDLASALVRHQVTFALTMASVNVRVFLYRWGLGGVDVSALVKSFDAMRLELRGLAPSAAGAMA
jgi:hypothetical protein